MQRRRHGGLCTTGGTVQGPEPRHPIASDSEDDETWRCPTAGNTASPQVVPESDPEEPDVCPDIRVLRKRRPTPALGLRTDLAQSHLDPDVGGPKKRRLCPKTTPAPDVGSKMAISDIRPQNHSPNPKGQVDPDVKHLGGSTVALGIESDTDDEVHPKSALFHPNHHQAALEASGDPNVEKRGPNPGAEGAQNGRWMLAVDSDTDVEEADVLPSVGCPKIRRKAHRVPKAPGVEMKPPNPDAGSSKNGFQTLVVDSDTDVEMESSNSAVEDPQRGHQAPGVDSDTDVEEGGANPVVGLAKTPQMTENTPNSSNIKMKSPHPAIKGPHKEHPPLTVDSDTDVEEDRANPDVVCLPTPQTTQNAPKPPNIEMETPNPDADGCQKENCMLVVDSDTDVEDNILLDVVSPKPHAMTPRDPGVETRGQDAEGPKMRRQSPLVDSDTDVDEDPSSAEGRDPKPHQITQNAQRNLDAEMQTLSPRPGEPQSGHEMLKVDSDTDVDEDPSDPEGRDPKPHQITQNAQRNTDVEMETPSPHPGEPQSGHEMRKVDSDTDVDEDPSDPEGRDPKPHQITQNAQRNTDVEMQTLSPRPGEPQSGHEMLKVDSDTDVDEDPSDPEGRDPKPHQITQNAQRNTDVEMETPSPHPGEPQSGHEMRKVDSDTDVDEDPSDPEGRDPKPHQITQNAQRNTDVEMQTLSPRPGEPQSGHEMLKVDSDTDVEEDGLNPDVGCPETHRMTPKIHSDSDVAIKTPNPDLEGPQNRGQNLEVDSDTDVEGEDLNPDIPGLKNRKTPQNAQKDPTVVMETPNPDAVGLHRGSMPPGSDSDTDVEGLEDTETPKTHRTTREVTGMGAKNAAAPDVDPRWHAWTKGGLNVEGTAPNPDVGQHMDLNVDSDTGVEDNGVVPDVGAVQGGQGTPGHPDVAMAPLDPDVSPPMTPQSGSDTDVEEVAPTPYVRSLRSKTQPRNPDVVDTTMGSDTNVGLTDPKCQKPAQKRQGLPPKSCSDGGVEGEVPKQHDLAPNTDAEDPNPDDKVQHNPQTSVMGSDTDVAPAGLAPKSPIPAPNLSLSGDAAWGSRSAQATPHGDMDVEVAESETEDDPDLFLEPTQSFLPPPVTEADAAPGWDPEEATQLFCHPKLEEEEEEEEKEEKKEEEEKEKEEEEKQEEEEKKEEEEKEEEPPQDIPATRVPPAEPVVVTPAQEGAGTGAAPSGDVTEGPRRSQRLARGHGGRAPGGGRASAVGGASGGGVASQARGGALPRPTPPRRSPRLQACPSPAEPPAKKGRGQEEPRPPPRPRPKRSGHAPSQKQTREEEELPEVAGLQLRPRGGAGSSSPKVLFTGVVASQDMEVALGSLGGSMATSVFDCTHLVTDRVRRTVKFLCAVARGIPIVTPKWLHESARSGRVLAPGSFLVRDSQQERHFGFSLSQALSHARRHPLLQGYEVHVTPSVRPEPEQMRDIVTCSGGTFLPTMPCTYGPRRLVISCGEDSGCWAPALSARLPLASAELLLTGLLRQRLQLQDFLLAPPEIPPGPSGVPQDPPPKSPQPPPVSPRRLRAPLPTQGRTRRDPPSTRRHPQPRNK